MQGMWSEVGGADATHLLERIHRSLTGRGKLVYKPVQRLLLLRLKDKRGLCDLQLVALFRLAVGRLVPTLVEQCTVGKFRTVLKLFTFVETLHLLLQCVKLRPECLGEQQCGNRWAWLGSWCARSQRRAHMCARTAHILHSTHLDLFFACLRRHPRLALLGLLLDDFLV